MMSDGQLICGGCGSEMITLKVHVLLLPQRSKATQLTRLVPAGKVEPLGGLQLTLVSPQLSVALTLQVTLLLLH
jgi:hypothetical protein